MNAIILLFVIGILCLVFEVVMPGAVVGVIGGLLMAAGCVLSFIHYGSMYGLLATAAALAALGLMFYVEFRVLPRTRIGRPLFVQSTVGSTSQAPLAGDEIIGRQGETLTTLAPSGYISVDGRRYEAFCRAGHIPLGTQVRVVGRDAFRIIVGPLS